MRRRHRFRRSAILALLVGLSSCGELPDGIQTGLELQIAITAPETLLVFDTARVRVEARDPEGRLVVDPPLEWGPLEADAILSEEPTALVLVGHREITMPLESRVVPGTPGYEATSESVDLVIEYGPLTVTFVGVGSDTLITAPGRVSIPAHMFDHRDRPVDERLVLHKGTCHTTEVPTECWQQQPQGFVGEIVRPGDDMLVIGGAQFCERCRDTLVVNVRLPATDLDAMDVVATSIGDTLQLPVEVRAENGVLIPDPPVAWALVDPADSAVIQLAETRVVALAPGSALVVASIEELADTALVTVDPQFATLQIVGVPSAADNIGWTDTATVIGWDARGNLLSSPSGSAEWQTSDSSVIALDVLGSYATAVISRRYGAATITAAVESCTPECAEKKDSVRIVATPAVDSVSITPGLDTLHYLGDYEQLTVTAHDTAGAWTLDYGTWTSLDPEVASVDDNGVVTALAEGLADIQLTVDTLSDTATVVVEQVVASVDVGVGPPLVVGALDTLSVAAFDSAGHPTTPASVTWSSADPSIATVSDGGVVEAIRGGGATIYVTADGVQAEARIITLGAEYRLGRANGTVCVISEAGTLYCGLDTLRYESIEDVTVVSGGLGSLCAVRSSGAVLCEGENGYGQLGVGDLSFHSEPTPLAHEGAFATVSVAGPTYALGSSYDRSHSCGILASDGRALCWGHSGFGQLGYDPTTNEVAEPRYVQTDLRFTDIEVGATATCALADTGGAYCWGMYEVLGLSSSEVTAVAGSGGLVEITAGAGFNCGLTAVGEAYCWGANQGRLGNGDTTASVVPVAVAGGHTFTEIDSGTEHTCGLSADGLILCWGLNGLMQLGDGTTETRMTPVVAAEGQTFTHVSVGDRLSAGVTTTGALWVWGQPTYPEGSSSPSPGFRKRVLVIGRTGG